MSSKLRETVSRLVREIEDGMLVELSSKFECDLAKALLTDVKAALAEPLRNCDIYSTEDDAWKAFCEIHPDAKCPDEYWSEQYQMWLFKQVKGK